MSVCISKRQVKLRLVFYPVVLFLPFDPNQGSLTLLRVDVPTPHFLRVRFLCPVPVGPFILTPLPRVTLRSGRNE